MGETFVDRAAREFARIALAAAVPVMKIYGRDVEAKLKADHSPVTEADEAAEALIHAALSQSFPGLQIVAEEFCAQHGVPNAVASTAIFVDPLDGTREFLARNGEFTINIGLVRDGVPIAGAVCAPAFGRLWWGGAQAFCAHVLPGEDMPSAAASIPVQTRTAAEPMTVLESRSHVTEQTKQALARLGQAVCKPVGSSLKFCLIASGEADVCLRFGPTMEWDTAAGDAVLRAAGGITLGPNGAPLTYGKAERGFRNPSFAAWGDPARAQAYADLVDE